jgi:hypothetical protein
MVEDYEELYCGTTFFNKKGTSEEERAGGVKWNPVSEPQWDSEVDGIPANPEWEGPKNEVTLEQLYTAEDLVSVGTRLASVAAEVEADLLKVFGGT